MFSWLKKLFTRVEHRVVEVEKGTRLPELTTEVKESLKSLQYHPGFQYLQAKLRLERATLQRYLHEGFTLTEGQLHHLQGGIHYLGYLESELAKHLKADIRTVRTATSNEVEHLDKFISNLETVGDES